MFIKPTVKVQAIVILTSGTDVSSGLGSRTSVTDPYSNSRTQTDLVRADSKPWEQSSLIFNSTAMGITPNTHLVGVPSGSQSVILSNTFSSVPVIWQQELEAQY